MATNGKPLRPPAVVIVARHGYRLDAADSSWHLHTPTPYDPPLTYGGWNQCQALGSRIASLLHEREQELEKADETSASKSNGSTTGAESHYNNSASAEGSRKRNRRRHKVVIHSSPFLRCLQTSVAIAAGLALHAPSIEVTGQPVKRGRMPGEPGPRSGVLGGTTFSVASEGKQDLVHSIARKAMYEHTRPRKAKIRVDAFLGEWLNPSYFGGILAPPPSPMMMATAKAELMHNEAVDTFTPSAANKSSGGNLWGSGKGGVEGSALDDWSHVQQQLPARKRDRANSQDSVGSSGSTKGRRAHTRHGSYTSKLHSSEFSVYRPPVPNYAISSSDVIPKGYFAHARDACASVDYQWDSSRDPLSWGDGGEYDEEWSAMHKRFRRGLNRLIQWYSAHDADHRSEDALGIDQAERHTEEEQEDLVVIMVTHGAGCNALIGAFTGQPVLLDIGMASLTMAVRRGDAPLPLSPNPQSTIYARRNSLDLGLNSVYEMKLVSSSAHLRPGSNAGRASSPGKVDVRNGLLGPSLRADPDFNKAAAPSTWHRPSSGRGSMSAALGSIRRPLMTNAGSTDSLPTFSGARALSFVAGQTNSQPSTPGLWTPPAARTPNLMPHSPALSNVTLTPSMHPTAASSSTLTPLTLDSTPTPPATSTETRDGQSREDPEPSSDQPQPSTSDNIAPDSSAIDGSADEKQLGGASSDEDIISDLPSPGEWEKRPSGARVARKVRVTPKRRWTVNEDA